jgi:hypothetical protein
VDNSGYGELGVVADGGFIPVATLPGWTRGLCFHRQTAFVGTSRIIPRFRQYAPGLDVEKGLCGLHAVDARDGRILGSLVWPDGNQIFAVDWISRDVTCGFPFLMRETKATAARLKKIFYAFKTGTTKRT